MTSFLSVWYEGCCSVLNRAKCVVPRQGAQWASGCRWWLIEAESKQETAQRTTGGKSQTLNVWVFREVFSGGFSGEGGWIGKREKSEVQAILLCVVFLWAGRLGEGGQAEEMR